MGAIAHTRLASQLKESTRAAHQRLDHHPLLASLVRPGLCEADYLRALAALHAPIAWMETLTTTLPWAPPALLSRRSPALQCDLQAMGYLPWPCRVEPPGTASIEAGIAACYLLEGSCMGAAAIHRHLQRAAVVWPMEYFAVPNVTERWQGLWQWIAQLPALDVEATCRAANAMFDFLSRHMEDCADRALLPAV